MNIHTITIDDFYPCPGAIRLAALATPFETVEFGGHKYHGINRTFQPERFDEYLGKALGNKVSTKLGFFRMGNPAIKATSHIHWDNIGTPWACVWYLSEPNDPKCVAAGTSLWRHKESGLSRYPGLHPELSNKDYGMVKRLVDDGEDESKWDMIGLIPQAFNRIAVYPSDIFHARYPREAFGKDNADSRLIYVSFFDYEQQT